MTPANRPPQAAQQTVADVGEPTEAEAATIEMMKAVSSPSTPQPKCA
jgi:hypothetical protein